jgi:hypothetical protein
MLGCSVSLLQRRAAIAADLAEAALALDVPGTGNVVFATLVDDPASVGDHIDAFLGQIMLESASATSTVSAGFGYAVTIAEVAAAASSVSAGSGYAGSIVEAASAADTPSATVTGAVINNKAIDGTAGGQFSTTSTGTVTLTTTQPNDVIILSYFHNGGSGAHTIASVTSAHLTWAKRSQHGWGGGPSNNEIWWATASAPLTSEVITITLTPATNIDDAAYHAFGVSGCPNPSSPWDTDASLAAAFASVVNSTPASLTISGVSTSSSIPMLIGNTGTYNNIAIAAPSGTTAVRAEQINSGGILYARTSTFYKNYSSPLSGASFSSTQPGSSASWGMVIDALA